MSKQGTSDKDRALALTPVSRETLTRLERFVDVLLAWQQRKNLIATSTIPHVWTRHVADSLQLLPLVPDAKVWVDFGAGGGFPGVPIACALAGQAGAMVHLIESNGKKAAFLREVVRELELPAQVHQVRAEKFGDSWSGQADAVTARAVAPLKTLCDQAFPLIAHGAIGVFPKGQHVEAELTEAAKCWTITVAKVPSKTSPEGCILVITGLQARTKARPR